LAHVKDGSMLRQLCVENCYLLPIQTAAECRSRSSCLFTPYLNFQSKSLFWTIGGSSI